MIAETTSAQGSRCRAPLEERTPPATVPRRAKSSSSVSSSDSNPTAMDLDETGLVDPISDLRTHFFPDAEATPALTAEEDPAGDEDRRAIEEMEAEYEGQDVSRDERRRGEYGSPQLYHVILSPSQGRQDEATQLAGMVTNADVSPQWKPGFWGACYMENRHPLRGHRRLKLERPNSTFKANSSDGRPGRAATHISAQEEDDHQMIHPGTSSTRRQNRIGSEVIRRLSDERLNCFFLMLYFILY